MWYKSTFYFTFCLLVDCEFVGVCVGSFVVEAGSVVGGAVGIIGAGSVVGGGGS